MVIFIFATSTSYPITSRQLKELKDRGEKITLIDIRGNRLFRQGHIPGAINIPFPLIGRKRLPPIGRVVVYGDGIRTDLTREAVDILNSKHGIRAEMLDGGFPAWEALHLTITGRKSFKEEKFHYITYEEFLKIITSEPDLILVDLRLSDSSSGAPDLAARFPGVKIIRPVPLEKGNVSPGMRWNLQEIIAGKIRGNSKLYILIDSGNGESEKVAHRLKGAGIKRLAILIGGQITIEREGKRGKKTIRMRSR